jgi:RnfABCDGE-type electron transport complex D subunit
MRFLARLLDRAGERVKRSPAAPLYPLVEAVTAALFSPDEAAGQAPFVRDALSTKRFVIAVVIALFPVLALATWFYGLKVPVMLVVAYGTGAVVESVFAWRRGEHIHEGFLVTGMLMVLIFPVTTPLWVFVIATVFGIVFGKEVFGGVGRNPVNPALVGRLFVFLSWPALVAPSAYPEPAYRLLEWFSPGADAVTAATPLAQLKSGALPPDASLLQLLWEVKPGCIGEISAGLLILGGLYLIFVRVVNFRVPLGMLAGSAAATLLLGIFRPMPDLVGAWLTGGFLLGMFFMATDPVTIPATRAGKWIAGGLCGLLVVLIRALTPLVEGVMFAIVLMNLASPLVDEGVRALERRREARYE